MQTFDLTAALPDRSSSPHTRRAYYRWVDRYLVDHVGMKPTRGDDRIARMAALPMNRLVKVLTPRRLKNWLDQLVDEGHGRQSLDQARAAIVSLSDLLAEARVIDNEHAEQIRSVSVPPVAHKTPPDTLLSSGQLKRIMGAARDMATSDNQRHRNVVIATMLCTMALRREELSAARWGDITLHNGKVILVIGGEDAVEIPRLVLNAIDRWRKAIAGETREPPPASPLVRRIWKGGRIARAGLSPDGIWLIIRDAARYANMDHVTPDDLRRSAAAGLRDAGVPTEEISRLLRHRSVVVTERFLSKLPKSSK